MKYAKQRLNVPEGKEAVSLVQRNTDVLSAFGRVVLGRGLNGKAMVLLLIEVDSAWRWFVDDLMPGMDWRPLQARAARTHGKAMAAGAQPREYVRRLLLSRGLDIGPSLDDPPCGPGEFWVVVCGRALVLAQFRPAAAVTTAERALDQVAAAEMDRVWRRLDEADFPPRGGR